MTPLMCGISTMTQMNLPMKQTQTHRHRDQTCGCQGGKSGWMDWEFGISRSKLLHSEWINKVLLHSKGNNIQFPTINHNRKEYEKEHIYRCKSLFYTVEINTTLCDTSETEGPGATPTMCSRQDLEQSLPLRGEGYYHLYGELR